MPSLMSPSQVEQIRNVLADVGDTFPTPITLIRTSYVNGAFASANAPVEVPLTCIPESRSTDTEGSFAIGAGVQSASEYEIFISWRQLVDASLIDGNNRALITNSDLIRMYGEIYEIKFADGVGNMTSLPSFLRLYLKRRFQSPQGAANP